MTSPDEREQELRAELAFDGRDGAPVFDEDIDKTLAVIRNGEEAGL